MDQPVDLTNLRSMTDGDAEMERLLFQEFYSAFENGIQRLEVSFTDAQAETWRKESHALKGVALNLGAAKLGQLCKNGQDSYMAPGAEKQDLLQDIKGEYARVKEYLSLLA